MSARLTEWLSRLASISGDSRRALVRYVTARQWDLQDFELNVIKAVSLPRELVNLLSPFEKSVMQRVWRSDFDESQWAMGTFDFLSNPAVQTRPGAAKDSLGLITEASWLQQPGSGEYFEDPTYLLAAPSRRRPVDVRRPASAGANTRRSFGRGPMPRRAAFKQEYAGEPRALSPVPVMTAQPRQCSNKWHEGQPVMSRDSFLVEYMGGLLEVGAHQVYYIDNAGSILVGWDGSTSPPCGMDGQPLVEHNIRSRNMHNTSASNRRSGKHMAAKLSSSNWTEAQPRVSKERFLVKYVGTDLVVEPNEVYYVDNMGRVLVGYNGTVSPPCGMDGQPLVANAVSSGSRHSRSLAPHYLTRPDAKHVSRPNFASPRLSSSFWEQAQPEVSDRPFMVKHAGGHLQVDADEVYYTDDLGRVLVGWHGTVSPPCDMDGQFLVAR
jgi:hypothetical protein